jgi:hypothetical protein
MTLSLRRKQKPYDLNYEKSRARCCLFLVLELQGISVSNNIIGRAGELCLFRDRREQSHDLHPCGSA